MAAAAQARRATAEHPAVTDDKVLLRLKKLHARAVGGSTVHECATAASFFIASLDQHHPAIRFCFPAGTPVRVLPVRSLNKAEATKLLRSPKAHRAGSFTEAQRVTDPDVSKTALAKGYLSFQRHGFYVFVPLAALDLRV